MGLRALSYVLVSTMKRGCVGSDSFIVDLIEALEDYNDSNLVYSTTLYPQLRIRSTIDNNIPDMSSTPIPPTTINMVEAICSIGSVGSLSEIPESPSFEVRDELGRGQTGTVLSVRLSNGDYAALKCACVAGRFLLSDYGALLDLQPTGLVPKVWGYHKRKGAGDCYFMSLLGPSLRTIRQKTAPRLWPHRTLATIGILMLASIETFSTPEYGYILHGDAFAGNVVVGASSDLSDELFFIDFDLSRRKYIPRDFYPEVRQVLYTLRYLYNGDESSQFFQIVDHRSCHDKYAIDCAPAHPNLCEAIAYACSFNGVPGKRDDDPVQEIDLGKILTLLRGMLEGGQEDGLIFWPRWIKQKMATFDRQKHV